jgi:hypothetical protein
VGNDVGDRLAPHGPGDTLTGQHGVDDLGRLIAQFPHADLPVRRGGTSATS